MSGGKVNIHVLMALAAFASVFMGNGLEGGLLLAMFNLAHIGNPFSKAYAEAYLFGGKFSHLMCLW